MTRISLHERLMEEARLIRRFERFFGYPPPPIAAESPDLASALRDALDAGQAPEGWSPTCDWTSTFFPMCDETGLQEGD